MSKKKNKKDGRKEFMTSHKFSVELIYGDIGLLERYRHQFTSLVRTFYNSMVENPKFTVKQANEQIKNYKNIELMDSYMVNCAHAKAYEIYKRHNENVDEPAGHKLVFGKKSNLIKTSKHKLTNKEFKELRILPLCLIGQADRKSNRRVRIKNKRILEFVVDSKVVFVFRITDKRCGLLNLLKEKQDNCLMPITYTIGKNYISVSYDQRYVTVPKKYNLLENRFMSMDLNPDYIGITVFDVDEDNNRNIIKAFVIDWYDITDKQIKLKQESGSRNNRYLTNKRKHEIKEIGKHISDLSVQYKCNYIVLENLKFKKKGTGFRISKWNKNLISQSIFKHSVKNGVTVLRINPAYTSIIGNIICKHNMPDMCRSAYEIGYRAVKGIKNGNFNSSLIDKNQYIHSIKDIKNFIIKSMEERGDKEKKIEECKKIKSLQDLNSFMWDNKINYRTSIESCCDNETVYIFKTKKSLVKIRSYSVRHYEKKIA